VQVLGTTDIKKIAATYDVPPE